MLLFVSLFFLIILISYLTKKDLKYSKSIIYEIKGQKSKTLPFSPSQLTSISVTWDNRNYNQPVDPGVYFYKMNIVYQENSKKWFN